MKTRIFNLIILDESGSMQTIKRATINGVNETVQTIRAAQKKHENQEHFVSLVTFNSEAVKNVYECSPVAEVRELTDERYTPNCGTPLYDAMGNALNALRPKVAPDDKVLVTIVTDGEENSSREYDGNAIKSLVNELKGKGWVFVYIGANQNVEQVAATISVTNVMNFQATPKGISAMMELVNTKRSSLFDRIAHNISNAEKENEHFFDDL